MAPVEMESLASGARWARRHSIMRRTVMNRSAARLAIARSMT